MKLDNKIFDWSGKLVVSGTPEGFDSWVLAEIARNTAKQSSGCVLHVARDDTRLAVMRDALQFFSPDITVLTFPAWDCLPYDRISPNTEIASRRMAALAGMLAHLHGGSRSSEPIIILTTVNAALQKVPARAALRDSSFVTAKGQAANIDVLIDYLSKNGYTRSSTVMEPGEFAVRGGIVDIFPPAREVPVRLDFFGDEVESIREFDSETQRTIGPIDHLAIVPVSEVPLDETGINRFRSGYRAEFGAVINDALYEAVSEGRKYQGMEHWLPLFHDQMETLFDYIPDGIVTLDNLTEEARKARLDMIEDYYRARRGNDEEDTTFNDAAYKPLAPSRLYLSENSWQEIIQKRNVRQLLPFDSPDGTEKADAGAKLGRNFAPERGQDGTNIFDSLANHILELRKRGQKVFIASYSEGARDRMEIVLNDHGIERTVRADSWSGAMQMPEEAITLFVLGLEHGFETDRVTVIAEQDILGDRLVRPRKKSRKAENFLTEAASLTTGDLVVHVDHGIGQYHGLETVEVTGAPHECLLILYSGGDKLYLPVENIELLSRFGGEESGVQLDKLGGSGWQSRKAKLKQRIREIAEELIKVAAARALKVTDPISPPAGIYEEFEARFPYEPTEDQQRAISDVEEDLGSGRPMDRLVCGDVGFGKTEVALRSAFIAAMSGRQVAVVVPTTLLARQHYKEFVERFKGWPLRIAQLSRLVSGKEAIATKKELSEGQVDIVIGTHALLGKNISFKNLGLVIIDEEQHFGVKHKERLKELKSDIHVLTLTATPIPRTLQLAMNGVREMSLIATPPVDRLAVRTFVLPFDQVTVREALLREHYRGGQTFYVCPRIADLEEIEVFLRDFVPEVKVATAHGQMAAGDLDRIMNAFYDGQFDVLLSTTIVESGLDVPTANTMIVHRADMFGLAQLYQIRGRIGRSKIRAYAYLTTPQRKPLTPAAEKRLKVLQSLDTLGAGFSLASHDLDIRGAGNLLGDEQSGHIKEVGFQLYQDMLEEAVAQLREGGNLDTVGEQWSPQINLGMAVLIPDHYVPDLNVRLSLYRRLSEVEDKTEMEGLAAEMIDRFGPLPNEVKQLMNIVTIKKQCRIANIEKIDAGPKGAMISFRNNEFPNPAALLGFIQQESRTIKIRPDQKLVARRNWSTEKDRLQGAFYLVRDIAKLVNKKN